MKLRKAFQKGLSNLKKGLSVFEKWFGDLVFEPPGRIPELLGKAVNAGNN